jgi:hypothetical protein
VRKQVPSHTLKEQSKRQEGTNRAELTKQTRPRKGRSKAVSNKKRQFMCFELNVCAVAQVVKEKQNKNIGNGVERARPTFLKNNSLEKGSGTGPA